MKIIGIDPGYKNAAYSLFIDGGLEEIGNLATKEDPITEDKVKSLFDRVQPDVVVIENVHSSPKQGVTSAFNFGWSIGLIDGVAIGSGIEVVLVTPQKWKAQFGLLKKPKDASRLKAIIEFNRFVRELRFKKSVDMADAIWIGYWYVLANTKF